MTTTKPKIQGYVSQWLADQFEAERERWDLAQSQALERILFERYGTQEQVKANLSISDESRLTSLEGIVEELLKRVATLEILKITSNLESDTQEITSNLESDIVLVKEITSNLEGDIVEEITSNLEDNLQEITSNLEDDAQEITSNLEGDTLLVEREITSNLESDTLLVEEITSNLDGDIVEEITSNPESDTDNYHWMTFEEAWATLPAPKPKDWDDDEEGMLKTRAKRQLREARTGSDHWAGFAIKLFRTIGFELDLSKGEQCFRKLPEPINYVWNLYDPDGQLVEGGFNRKREAQLFCRNYEDKERVRRWRWEYEPSQLSLVD